MTTDFVGGPTDVSASVAIQNDGKIVVTGAADMGTGGPYDFAVARYGTADPPPTPVPGVGSPGLLALAVGLAALVVLTATRRRRSRMS